MAFINYKRILLALFLLILNNSLFSQEFSEEKNIKKAFRVSPTTTVSIINKYGKIHIKTWDKDSVKFDVKVAIKSNNEENLEEIMNSIDFNFTSTSYFVSAKTILGGQRTSIFSDIQRIAAIMKASESNIRINYTINLPAYVDLKIDNKYGDIYIDDLKTSVDIDLSNGDLKANNFTGNTDIDLKFGNAIINSLNDGNINISYSEFDIKKAGQLNITSKSSEVKIETTNVLKANSKRDELRLETVNFVYGETYFSKIEIKTLNNELNVDAKYGEITIMETKKGFSFINIISKYSDITIFFQKETSFNVDVTQQDVDFKYPENSAKINTKSLSEADTEKKISYGNIGTDANSKSKVKINAENCSINLNYKK